MVRDAICQIWLHFATRQELTRPACEPTVGQFPLYKNTKITYVFIVYLGFMYESGFYSIGKERELLWLIIFH
jgi:hypothetical protein